MRILYSLILYALLPLILIRLLLRSIKNPEYRRRIAERFGIFNGAPSANGIWVHAVSVGEAIAAIKLIRALQQRYPERAITISCGTPTGSAIIRAQLGEDIFHVYAPYDLPGSVRRFLNKVKPTVGIIMETEIWPNLIHQASRSGARLMISNMRLSERSCRRYHYISTLISRSLSKLDCIAAQTDKDAQRAISLGADAARVQVVGNLKFEMDEQKFSGELSGAKLKEHLASHRTIWLAGSTHQGEDQMVLQVHAALLEHDPQLLLILAPRHPERFDTVYRLCRERFRTQRRSELGHEFSLSADCQVLLADSMGELQRFIGISDWAFIGGSLVPVGGHNILEACQQGVPVLYGKNMHNFKQISSIVNAEKAGIQLENEAQLLQTSLRLLEHPESRAEMGRKGHTLIREHRGALSATLELLEPWLLTSL